MHLVIITTLYHRSGLRQSQRQLESHGEFATKQDVYILQVRVVMNKGEDTTAEAQVRNVGDAGPKVTNHARLKPKFTFCITEIQLCAMHGVSLCLIYDVSRMDCALITPRTLEASVSCCRATSPRDLVRPMSCLARQCFVAPRAPPRAGCYESTRWYNLRPRVSQNR